MDIKFISVFLLIIIGCVGCSTPQKRQSRQTSILTAAINDSIKIGRFDRAKEFSDQLSKLNSPPRVKDRIKINEFKTVKINVSPKKGIFTKEELIEDKKYVVLPPGFSLENVIVKNDDKFKEILHDNPNLKKEEIKVDKIVDNSNKNVDSILIDKEKELNKARESKGIFKWLKSLFGWGIFASLIILVVIIVFFPALLPMVGSFLGSFVNYLIRFVISSAKFVVNFVRKIIDRDG